MARPMPREEPVMRAILLVKRVHTFQSLISLVVQLQRAHRQVGNATNVSGVSVERVLEELEGGGALLQQLLSPGLGLFHELVRRYYLVYQPHLQGFLRRVLAAEVPDLPCLLFAHNPSKIGATIAGVEATDTRTGLAKARSIGSEGDVADHVQYMTPADGKAVDRSDYRFRDVADDIMQPLHVHLMASRAGVIAPLATFALVATGTKRLVTCAGEDHHTDGVVPPSVLDCRCYRDH